jgi:hypothetical protein
MFRRTRTFETFSKENCHVKGLHSLVLRPGNRMIRMYIAEPGIELNFDLFKPTIAYHCHQYNIHIECLDGVLMNHVLKVGKGKFSKMIQGWNFSSQLNGENGSMFEKSGVSKSILSCTSDKLEDGHVYEGNSSEYHTVSIPKQRGFVSWLVRESAPTHGYDSTVYSNADLSSLNADGLYQSMSKNRYMELLELAESNMTNGSISRLRSFLI